MPGLIREHVIFLNKNKSPEFEKDPGSPKMRAGDISACSYNTIFLKQIHSLYMTADSLMATIHSLALGIRRKLMFL